MAVYSNKERKEIDQAISHLKAFVFANDADTETEEAIESLMDEIISMAADLLNREFDTVVRQVMSLEDYDHLFSYVFEIVINWDEEDSTINQYLRQRGWREGPHGKKFLRALANSQVRLWEVIDISESDGWVEVKRFGTDGKPKRVYDQGVSESALPGYVFAARVLPFNKRRIFSQSLLSLTPSQASQMNKLPDEARTQVTEAYQLLIDRGEMERVPDSLERDIEATTEDMMINAVAVGWIRARLGSPDIRNTDDERIVMNKYHFPLEGDTTEIKTKLNEQFESVEDQCWHWLNDQNKVVAQIEMNDKHLIVDTNSVERSQRVNDRLSELLGSLVGTPLGMSTSVEDALANRHPTLSHGADVPMTPEAQATIETYLTQHYRQTLDESIPMLGDKSPRECAADEKQRYKTIGWLQELEKQHDKDQPYDLTWMWEELDLMEHRP